MELKDIYAWKHNPGSVILKIMLSDGSSFRCTPDHKIWTSFGWVPAGMLTTGHTIPRQSISDSPYRPRGNTIGFSQYSLRRIGVVNFNNLLFRKFGPTSFFASKIIVTFSDVLSKFRPSFAAPNLLNCPKFYSKSFGKNVGCFAAASNYSRLFSSENSARSIFMHWKRAMSFGIGNVFGSRSIFEITKSGIGSIPVFMPNLLTVSRVADESHHNGLMNKYLFRKPGSVSVETRISLMWRRFKDFFRDTKRSLSLSRNNSRLATNAAKVAYAVKSLETHERFPILVQEVGHVDETFCLSVKDNHSFFVGNGKGVLVSNCDDPHSVEGANSEAMRASTLEWFTEAVPTRLNNPRESAIVVIMQRLHEEDVSGIILDRKGFAGTYDHIVLPMRYEKWRAGTETWLGYEDPRTEEGELLFPDRFPRDVVDDLEGKLGPYATAGQHQQAPTPRGGGIIKDSWWQLYDRDDFPPIEFVVASLDTAYSSKADARGDFSAMTIWGVFAGDATKNLTRNVDRYGKNYAAPIQSYYSPELNAVPRVILMHAWSERLELHELVLKVAQDCRALKVDKILVENKAAGHSVAQELRRLFGYEDFAVQLYDPKSIDKLGRLYSVQHLFAEGMIYAPDKDWAEMVIRQVSSFPRGKHDDLVDTVSMALRHLRDLGLLTRSPERLAEIDQSKDYTAHKTPPPLYGI